MSPIVTILLLILIQVSKQQEQSDQWSEQFEIDTIPPCYSSTTCSECILLPSNCSWCSDKDFNDNHFHRCESDSRILESNKCTKIVSPTGKVTVPKEENFGKLTQPVNLIPKRLKLKLRPGQPLKFNLTLKQEENYPVDLYYLMDLTYSMKDHKESLGFLADQLSAEMSKITANFRLGFGSFIDKIVMPFASMVPRKLINPCSDGVECIKPYSFRNHLSLTEMYENFTAEVKLAGLSGNLDNAEGGLDAIVQSIVCKESIKWDKNFGAENLDKFDGIRRKILLFATGSEFHFAGDGKLGGVIKKNDLQCHLDSNGYYDASLAQDYPSVSQVATVVQSNKVNLIFAVTQESVPIYEKLSRMIDGATVGILSEDSSNIVDLIRKNYDKIVSKIELISDANHEGLSVKFKSKCKGVELRNTNYCNDIKIGDSVDFEVSISIDKCPSAQTRENFPRKITISPIGLNVDTIVELEVICSCDCEDMDNVRRPQVLSKECSNKGILSCGICSCAENNFGKFCECDKSTRSKVSKLDECRRPITSHFTDGHTDVSNVALSKNECSNRGMCNCGICSCDSPAKKGESFYGKYCECDTFTCERSLSGQVCGGHGKCCDGSCICDIGWTGNDCDCTTDTKSCLGPNGQICSGNGQCFCGQCKCGIRSVTKNVSSLEYDEKNSEKFEEKFLELDEQSSTGLFYVGTFCEQCLNCDGKCSEIEECIKCRHYPDTSDMTEEDCIMSCLKFDIFFLKSSNETEKENFLTTEETPGRILLKQNFIEPPPTLISMKKCKFSAGDNCYIDFFYEFNYESERASVYVNSESQTCAESINIWIIIGSIVALIVLIGLFLICIIRFGVYLKDRRDFLIWQEEVEKSKKDLGGKNLNPLYREANTKYNNPLYGN